jgi:hypothetical protein
MTGDWVVELRDRQQIGELLYEYCRTLDAMERADGTTATMMGQYHDELVRRNGRWLIARRRQVLTGNDAGFTVDINRFERRSDPRTSEER